MVAVFGDNRNGPSPRRTLLVTTGLFALVCAAAIVTWTTRYRPQLTGPVRFPGWGIAVKVPTEWHDAGEMTDLLRSTVHVYESPGGDAAIRIRRMPLAQDSTLQDACHAILAQYVVLSGGHLTNGVQPEAIRFGPWPGQVFALGASTPTGGDPVFQIVVGVGRKPSRTAANDAYSIELQAAGGIDRRHRRIWQAVMDSVDDVAGS